MEKKYELTDETIEVGRKTLRRIRALKDFGDVKADDLSGFIAKEDNLSHHGNCWIGGYAKVYDDAKVYENAQVYDKSRIYGKAEVFDEPCIYGHAEVYGDAHIYGHAKIYGEACICWDDWIDGDKRISTRKQTR
ncbi:MULTISPECIES: hypothetical protein [unclassified Bartonella]|uniref:hypothetical protein n=1 Tax=unclassified Bartonella TaxID=2645622 RepID=UPI0023606CEE|nr:MULTISPECIES: hypothetical protein [unclassified Bartonella]